MSRDNEKQTLHIKEGELCAMTEIVNTMKDDIGTLKDGQDKMKVELIKMSSEFKGFLDVYKVQREDMANMLHEMKDSNTLLSKHVRELEKANAESKQQSEIIKSQCLIKEKELILEIEKVRSESIRANMKQDFDAQSNKLKEVNGGFWNKLGDGVVQAIISGLILAGSTGILYMIYKGIQQFN